MDGVGGTVSSYAHRVLIVGDDCGVVKGSRPEGLQAKELHFRPISEADVSAVSLGRIERCHGLPAGLGSLLSSFFVIVEAVGMQSLAAPRSLSRLLLVRGSLVTVFVFVGDAQEAVLHKVRVTEVPCNLCP